MKNIENFESNYYFKINESDSVDVASWENSEEEEYFDEFSISFEYLIPQFNNEFDLTELSFSYIFEFYKNSSGSCEISFNDMNRPTLNLINYSLSEEGLENLKNNYTKQEISKSFEHFVIDTSVKKIKEKFSEINENYFFMGKVNKKKVILNDKLLKKLESNFYADIADFLEKIKEHKYVSLTEKYENLSKDDLEEFSVLISKSEIKSNFNSLTKQISDKQNPNKIKKI